MLDKMQMFIVLAECRSFTETARRMFCSQPTISHQIQQLEEKYKTILIQRKNRQIELTEQGKVFLQYARKILLLDKQMEQELHQVNSPLSVHISHYIAEKYFATILPLHIDEFEQQSFSIKSNCYENLKEKLLLEKTNFAIMPIYENDSEFQQAYKVDLLFEEELFLIMHCSHPLAGRKVIYARDLKNQTLLLPENLYLQQLIKDKIDQKNAQVQYMQMTNFEIIKQAVLSGMGISFLPLKIIEPLLGQNKIMAKSIHGLCIKRQNAIVSNPQKTLTQRELNFCKYVKNQFIHYGKPLLNANRMN